MPPRPTMLRFGVVGALLLVAASAGADESEKARCASAYERAQELQRNEALGAARKQLVVCSETCPDRLRRDCLSWIRDVDALMPTIVLRPRDGEGHPIRTLRVTIDGELRTEDVDPAQPIAVDPGSHIVRFESSDFDAADVKVSVHGGERAREVAITLWPKAPPPKPPPSEAERAPAMPKHHRTSAYVFGIGGLVAIAAGGGLGIAGQLKKTHLASQCAPFCDRSDADGVVLLWRLGAITAAVGAVALGIGTYLWFSPPTGSASAATVKRRLWASVGAFGGSFD